MDEIRRRMPLAAATFVRKWLLRAAERADLKPQPYWPGYGYPPPPGDHGLPDDTFIVSPARHQIVYRLLNRGAPRRRDFECNREKGKPQGPNETFADYLGLSVFSDPELAITNAVRWPKHVASVLLPQSQRFSIARTYPQILGHYTIWGDPDSLLANVERVDTRGEPGTLDEA